MKLAVVNTLYFCLRAIRIESGSNGRTRSGQESRLVYHGLWSSPPSHQGNDSRCGNAAMHLSAIAAKILLLSLVVVSACRPSAGSRSVQELMYLATAGDYESVDSAIGGGFLVDTKDPWGNTLLHYACSTADMRLFRLLIGNGADADLVNNHGWNALHWAVDSKEVADSIPIIEALLAENLTIDTPTDDGSTPLLLACRTSESKLPEAIARVELLLERGADANVADSLGLAPLHVAASRGNLQVIEVLLNAGADPGAEDREGNSPRQALEGWIELVTSHGGQPPQSINATKRLLQEKKRMD